MSIKAKYDPLLFKFPKGVVTKNTSVNFKIELEGDEVPNKVYFMLKTDEESEYKYLEMEKQDNVYKFDYKFKQSGHFWYNFQLVFDNFVLYLNKTYDTRSVLSNEKQEDFLQLVTEKDYSLNNSMQGGIIYQIFMDRFCRVGEVKSREPLVLREDWGGKIKKNTDNPILINQEVFGGNILGLISKLDYLQELGVTIIYLNPISEANSNHKYDTADYMKIDPMFGTETEFKTLIDEAKKRGIGIVIDGVYNHTGSDSIYFNKTGKYATLGAYRSKKSRFYSWYEFEEYPDKYKSWWGIDTLPSIKDNCEDFQDFIAGKNGVLEKFLQLGIKGVRLDVVDEITDEFVQKIENKVHKFGDDKVLIGEVWEDASTKISYSKRRSYFSKNELNSVMNYPVKETVLEFVKTKNANALVSTLRMLENNYPKAVRDNLMNFLTTHDTGRVFSELLAICGDDKQQTFNLYKIATSLIFTLPGVPSIFYGDEYGMENNDGSSRGCFDWQNYKNEIFDWFKKLTNVRKFECLKDGEFNILYSSNGKFAFERFNKNERLVFVANLESSVFNLELKGKFKSFLTGEYVANCVLKQNNFEILIETKND